MTSSVRGRPRLFDDQKVLDQALALFWQRGFPATSYTELCAATGLNKPSLYAAFGNKEAMFLAALELYRARQIAPALKALATEPDARIAVHRYLVMIVDGLTREGGPMGCMIVTNSACSEVPDVPSEVVQALLASSQETHDAFAARLTRAKADGHIPASADIPALQRFLEVLITGLAGLAKMGTPRADLLKAVDTAMHAWPD